MSPNGANASIQIKKRIAELNIDISHFSQTANASKTATHYTLEEILVVNSTYTNRSRLKERLLKEHLLEYRCACCGNTGEWMGQVLSL